MPRLRLLWGVALLGACAAPKEPPSWRLFPLERHSPHDGVAVVNQPDGYGLHIYLETDTSFPGVCRPRWLPDPARLFNGNGATPFSSGLATRQEFFDAVARRDVRALLERSWRLCARPAPLRIAGSGLSRPGATIRWFLCSCPHSKRKTC